jgi:signal transduction histidine kinase
MKIIFIIIQFIAAIGLYGTSLWAMVEFILYLVKDKAFNWWSVYGFILSFIIVLVFGLIINVKAQKNSINKRFEEQIQELKNRRENKLKN